MNPYPFASLVPGAWKRCACLLLAGLAVQSALCAGTAQTITFPAIADHVTTDAPFALGGTASSGLAVSYSIVSPAGVATVAAGGTVTLIGTTGAVTVRATQAGDATYDPAAEVYRTFLVGDSSLRFVKIATGSYGHHTAGIRADGTLWTWGYNVYGQLGDGTTTNRSSPVQVGSATWLAVSCADDRTVAVRSDGTLWNWGSGLGTSPVQVGTGTTWSNVSCGGSHTMVLRADGTLWGWGTNTYGQIGDGTTTTRSIPVQIGTATNWNLVACGLSHTLARRADGTTWVWGNNDYGQLGDGSKVSRSSPVARGSGWLSLAGGGYHSVAVSSDGRIYAWGRNNFGQLGDGTTTDRTSAVLVGTATNWASVTCGLYHSNAIRTDGTLWGWGENDDCQVGDGSGGSVSSPAQVGTGTTWAAVTGGFGHSAALRTDGSVWTWGSDLFGQLGVGGVTVGAIPALVNPPGSGAPTAWLSVASGTSHSAAVRSDGTLWVWGLNDSGQLGNPALSHCAAPTRIGIVTNWKAVACGQYHTVALRTDGTLWAWGLNSNGRLGDGTFADRTTPVQVGSATTWTAVACGDDHTLGLRSDGTLWAWGGNANGRLGDATTTTRNAPVKIGAATNWSAIACGTNHSLGLRSDGTLWSWGLNTNGQLGSGGTSSRSSPGQVGSETAWRAVAGGTYHTAARRSDGTLWACGYNVSGQLGDGTTTQRTSLVQVGTGTDWTAVAAGSFHTVASRGDGSFWAWGDGTYGQLGNGSLAGSTIPVQQAGAVGGSASVAAGIRTSFMLRSDGTLWVCGRNESSQAGTPDTGRPLRMRPAAVAQTLTLSSLPALTPNVPVTLAASADSGLPITYTVAGPATLSGNVLTPTDFGTITVAAYQNGDEVWLPATRQARAAVSAAPAAKIQVTGNGQTIQNNATLTSTTDNTDFGTATFSSGSIARTFVLTNTGTADLTVSAVQITAGDFSLTQTPSGTVAPGASTSLQITFAPVAAGLRRASVSFTSNDSDVPAFTFAIQGTGASPLQTWRQTYFGTSSNTGSAADDFDNDKDGLANLLEWACALNPTTRSVLPASLTRELGGGTLAYTYTRSLSALQAGVVYVIEWNDFPSATLGTWSTTGVSESILSSDAGTQTQQVRATLPAGSAGRRFIRLKVTAPP